MRIGFITYGLDRQPTGIGRYALELLRSLRELPNCPEIVLLHSETSDPQRLWQAFEHVPLRGCRRLPGLLTVGHQQIADAARKHKLDLIHDPNGVAPFLWPSLRQPCVVTIHDAFAYTAPETQANLDVWRARALLPRAAQRANLVITDSDWSRRDLIAHLKLAEARLRTIPLAAHSRFAPVTDPALLERVRQRYNLRPPYILYVGGLNPRKNIPALLTAFAVVRDRHPHLNLVIGGKRQWKTAEIDAALQHPALATGVQFTDYLRDDDLPALYSAASAFVFPSLYEGFGLPPLEALACGTPVICSNRTSLPEVVGDAAVLVDPSDSLLIADALRQVLEQPALAEHLRKRGPQQAAKFSWARTARETLNAYRWAKEHA